LGKNARNTLTHKNNDTYIDRQLKDVAKNAHTRNTNTNTNKTPKTAPKHTNIIHEDTAL
jgi:hypothetical protein